VILETFQLGKKVLADDANSSAHTGHRLVINNSQERENDAAAAADDDDVKKIQKFAGLGYNLELV
jgi:protein tyrosine phosphatase (PTP) superfamily phosphohydrolase (DUF442 family)